MEATEKLFELCGVKDGPCPLCRGEKERQLFIVRSVGYTGEICGQHLSVLVRQATAGNGQVPVAKPFGVDIPTPRKV